MPACLPAHPPACLPACLPVRLQKCDVVVADKASQASCVAMAALVAGMRRQRQKAILRWVAKAYSVRLMGRWGGLSWMGRVAGWLHGW